ncbi:hypothetical protein FN846DRAFT_399704 [Sphaerosporella brunnea]|uniref:Uncharacterized protein n=1 Tax=Sphaerosporella brunnea TaxID=1250544 RepID=A0A5J5EG14_9PEZI|nr:hypothetical protein FN846DRAFT_399704 [Sphaerosporella brunnea]
MQAATGAAASDKHGSLPTVCCAGECYPCSVLSPPPPYSVSSHSSSSLAPFPLLLRPPSSSLSPLLLFALLLHCDILLQLALSLIPRKIRILRTSQTFHSISQNEVRCFLRSFFPHYQLRRSLSIRKAASLWRCLLGLRQPQLRGLQKHLYQQPETYH